MKATYFENNAICATIAFGKKHIEMVVTRRSLRWTRVYKIERKDHNKKERFTNEKEVLEAFLHLGAGINMHDTCFALVTCYDWS